MIFFLDQITIDFPFFPTLHRFLSSRTNTNPPVITTGIGPGGRAVVHYQAPAGGAPPITDDHVGPALAGTANDSEVAALPFTDDVIDPDLWVISANSNVLRTTPAHTAPVFATQASLNKENMPPPYTIKKSIVGLPELVENAKTSIKRIPAKRNFEEMLCDLQR